MPVDIKTVSDLRARTGAGLMDAKKALEEAKGDVEKAIEILRIAGAAKAAKKSAERVAKEGLVACYIHAGGKVGTMIVLNCETDFVAATDKFKQLAKDIALQVAATNPDYVRVQDVPADVLTKEMEIYKEQMRAQGKPEAMLEKIAENKLNQFYAEKVLLMQPFIKDEAKTIEMMIQETVSAVGEKIELAKFTRFTV